MSSKKSIPLRVVFELIDETLGESDEDCSRIIVYEGKRVLGILVFHDEGGLTIKDAMDLVEFFRSLNPQGLNLEFINPVKYPSRGDYFTG